MKSTAKSVGTVFIIMMLSRTLSFFANIKYMTYFGIGLNMDIYSYAQQFPNIIFNSFGTALVTVVIPIFGGYIGTKDDKKAHKFANNIITLSITFAAVLALIGIALAPVFPLFTRFKSSGYDFAVTSLRIMFPVVIFYAMNYVLQGVLQSLGKFNMPALVSIPSSLIVILYVYFFGGKFAIPGLVVATFIGLAMQGLILIPPLYTTNYRFRPSFNLFDDDIKKAMLLVPPVLLGTCAYQVNMLFNVSASANFKDTVTIMAFVQNLILNSALAFIYSITAVIFPKLTMLASQNNMEAFRENLIKVIRYIIFLLVPATFGFVLMRHQLLNLVIGWNKVTKENVDLAADILALYSIGITGIGIKEVVDRAFYSLKNTIWPAINSIVVVAVNIIASLVLMRFKGPLGIPMAYSISAITGMVVLLCLLRMQIGEFGLKKLIGPVLKVVLSCIIMALAVILCTRLLSGFESGHAFIVKGVHLFVPAMVGALVYFSCTMLLKVEEAPELLSRFKAAIGR
ncbi:MAG TPA: murein biosynthesis integral membrane protein MurJ [Clostridia bacterium]